ncbi:MAG: hypothetical protein LRY40_04980 [Shewanella fodinae]|nr:hypothetical protein [Shewanella fodinae]
MIRSKVAIACHTANLGSSEHRLLMHGGKRFNFEGCVMCHTTYSADPETGNPIDMATLVHKNPSG